MRPAHSANVARFFYRDKLLCMSIANSHVSERSLSRSEWHVTAAALTVCTFTFTLMPLLGIFFMVVLAAHSRSRFPLFGLCTLVVIFFSTLNTAKVPESDLLQYYKLFNMSRSHDLFEFMFSEALRSYGAKEPVFRLFTKSANAIFLGSEAWYIAVFSTVPYVIGTAAMLKVFRYFEIPNSMAAVLLLVMLMNPLTFSISAHLIRQNLAFAFILFALAKLVTGEKAYWKWVVFGLFTHSLTLLFLPFFIIKGLRSQMSPRLLGVSLLFVITFIGGLIFLPKLLSLIQGLPFFLVYPLERLAQEIIAPTLDGSAGLAPLFSQIPIVVAVIFVLASLIPSVKNFSPLFLNVFLFISVLVFYSGIFPLFQYRIFYFIMNIVPFLFISLPVWRRCAPVVVFLLVPLYLLVFAIYFEESHWTYGEHMGAWDLLFLFLAGGLLR